MKLLIFCVVCCTLIWSSSTIRPGNCQNANSESRHTLYLIALLPFGNDANSSNCVDRGEELIPAAEIAIKRIDEMKILPNFKMKVIPARTNNCADNTAAAAVSLVSFANYSVQAQPGSNNSKTIIGVIGLVCSATMLTISPLASQPGIDFVQITSGITSPMAITRSRSQFNITNIFQTAPPSIIFNEALIALMKHQGWKNISIVRLSDSLIIDHETIAADLRDRINADNELFFRLLEVQTDAEILLEEIRNTGVRIIYASLPDDEARNLLCRGYKSNPKVVWPHYAWIMHGHSLKKLMKSTMDCDSATMARALQGVILLYYADIKDHNRILDTVEYDEYIREYRNRLDRISTGFENQACVNENQMFYANALHDSVLAFGMALNSSLNSSDLTASNLQEYTLGQHSVTEQILNHLQAVKFSGAGGIIKFNTKHEVDFSGVGVDIYQVDPDGSGNLLHPGFYNGSRIVSLTTINFIPSEFERITKKRPRWLPIISFIVTIILIILTTVILALFIYYWNSHDIKATSPILSLVILAACYMLYISILLVAIRVGFTENKAFASLCLVEYWFFLIGIQLLFSTLFWRLLRVYRIFFNYQKLGKLWSDYALLVYILLVVSVTVFLLILWTAIDHPKTEQVEELIQDTNSPHYDIYITCRSRHLAVWLGLTLGYFALLLILVVALAVMTRKVKIESFKDTKTVNAFIFITAIVLGFFITVSVILELGVRNNNVVAALTFCFDVLYRLVVAIACKVFLFAPKIYFARFPDEARHKTTSFTPTITNSLPQSQRRRSSAQI